MKADVDEAATVAQTNELFNFTGFFRRLLPWIIPFIKCMDRIKYFIHSFAYLIVTKTMSQEYFTRSFDANASPVTVFYFDN